MVHNTAKLGGTASDIVVGKVAVSQIHFRRDVTSAALAHISIFRMLSAWIDVDDLNAYPSLR